MGMDLIVIEKRMDLDIMPRLSNILLATPDVPANAFKAAFLESLSRNNTLTDKCTLQSILMSATTLACLGVLPGPFLGQGWLIPRKNKGVWQANAQLGYKGLNTIAARSGRTIESGVIRRADRYEIRLGSRPEINIWPNLEDSESAIIAAYSQQEFEGRRVSPMVIPMKELMAIKDKNSKASNKDDEEGSGFSPWNDPKVGLPAMCQKTATLRQRRTIPMGIFHYAGALDDLQEMGKAAWIVPNEAGKLSIITGDGDHIEPGEPVSSSADELADLPPELERPEFIIWLNVGHTKKDDWRDITEWKARFKKLIVSTDGKYMPMIREANGSVFLNLANAGYSNDVNEITRMIAEKEGAAQKGGA